MIKPRNRLFKKDDTSEQVHFIPERQDWFNIQNSITIIHNINRIKEKNVIISLDVETTCDQVKHSFKKNLSANQGFGHEHLPKKKKKIYNQYHTRWWSIKCFPPVGREQDKDFPLSLQSNVGPKVPASALKHRKGIKI